MTSELEKLQRHVSALMTVQNIAQELTSELNLERLLHKILHAAVQVLNASDGSLSIWVPSDELVFAVAEDPTLVGHRIAADEGIAGWVFTHCETLIVKDVTQDARFSANVDQEFGFETQSLIAVPLMTPTQKIGVIEVLNKKSGGQFDEQDEDILTALAAQAAIAIVNAQLYQDLEEEKNRIIAVEEQMHKKLARELHDGPAQTLAAMMMDIEFVLKLYEREPERVPQELTELRQAAEKTLAQVRNTMFELRPVILETQGLGPAVTSYVKRLTETEGMHIELETCNLDQRLSSKVERTCFAIIQEAVSNVRKHTHDARTRIVIECRPNDLVVAVRDYGKGFDVPAVIQNYDRQGSLGLLNMKERAEVMGATYKLESVLGRGTLVYLIVPLNGGGNGPENAAGSNGQADELSSCQGRQETDTGTLGWSGNGSAPGAPGRERRKGTGPLNLMGTHRQNGSQKESS